jgi:hypothetical protein
MEWIKQHGDSMNQHDYSNFPEQRQAPPTAAPLNFPTPHLISLLLLIALLAFELFNFDTTKYALTDFFGETSFAGLRWATILAIAFCAIDFAGLVRFFTPEREGQTPVEVWYLMGAWMLGATLNALMTWWAVTLTLLNHDLGNEVLSREELLRVVPLFVAALVWLTRVLFIGAFSVIGGHIFDFGQARPSDHPQTARQPGQTAATLSNRQVNRAGRRRSYPQPQPTKTDDAPESFPFERPSIPHHIQRQPTAIYARSRRLSDEG